MVEDFSVRLKKALNIRRLRPVQLSEMLDINRAIISQYLSGKYKPNQNRLLEIANALKVNPVWLMGFDVDMEEEIEIIDELDFDNEVVNTLKDIVMNKLEKVDNDKKAEILDTLSWLLSKISKQLKKDGD